MSLFRRAVPGIALDSDPAQDDVALRAAYAAAQAGDWVPVGDLLAGTRGDVDRRGRYVAVLGKVGLGADVAAFAADPSGAVPRLDLTTAWVDRWVAAEPESPDAALLRARSFVDRAWEVRGSDWAKYVGQEAVARDELNVGGHDLNTFAYGLYQTDRHRDSKPVFEAIGPYATDIPWGWRGGDEEFL